MKEALIPYDREKPILENIKQNVHDGYLHPDFDLPQLDDGDIHYAIGAKDGIELYHMMRLEMTEDIQNEVSHFLDLILESKVEEVEKEMRRFNSEYPLISILSEVERQIITGNYPDKKDFFDCGLYYIFEGKEIPFVKFGLAISDCFIINEELFKEAIYDLSLCEEFSLYTFTQIANNEEYRDDLLFELVQKVRGWGKVHGVRLLKGNTQEEKDWLLHQGMKNDVLSNYSATECFIKGDALGRMERGLTKEECVSIGRILSEMIDGEPVSSLEDLENPNEVLTKFISQADTFTFEPKEEKFIQTIKDYLKSQS